jgi:hypothetical protein
MDTQCGFLRTAIGMPTRETVADLCSYFAQAAQSNSEEGTYEAPMTIAEMQQRSISNVLSNEHVSITLQSFYFTPVGQQQEKVAHEVYSHFITV